MLDEIRQLSRELVECRRCPRLVAWREHVATEKRASFQDEEYWGRPVPGFGDPQARIVVVGLAPAAHGANRTGRMFTGDRSGEWLFRALHRAGLANQPTSKHADDGLRLDDAWVTSTVKCAPPANKPTPAERDACNEWLRQEIGLLRSVVVYVCLGQFGYHALWASLRQSGIELPTPRPRFRHGLEVRLHDGGTLLGSYHPSQQNTFTGRLTEPMFDEVFARAKELVT